MFRHLLAIPSVTLTISGLNLLSSSFASNSALHDNIRPIQIMKPLLATSNSSSFSSSSSTTIALSDLDEWEQEKQSCPKCKAYIESPCRREFKAMSICSSTALENHRDIESCMDKLLPLLACEKRNLNYFQSNPDLETAEFDEE